MLCDLTDDYKNNMISYMEKKNKEYDVKIISHNDLFRNKKMKKKRFINLTINENDRSLAPSLAWFIEYQTPQQRTKKKKFPCLCNLLYPIACSTTLFSLTMVQ